MPDKKTPTPKVVKPVDFVFPDGVIRRVKPGDAPEGARRATTRDRAIAGFPTR